MALAVLLPPFLVIGQPTCTTDFTNKYDLTSPPLAASAVTVANSAACTFPTTVDTKLYLGDPYSGSNRPSKNRDYGLQFDGDKIAVIKASTYHSISSNWIQATGSTITMWVYIFDNQRDQVLMCKAAKNSGSQIPDRLCFGIRDGHFYGSVYNETLVFDLDVNEGWNFLALIVGKDSLNLYTRLKVVAYNRAHVSIGVRTYSYTYYDDPGLDMYFGAKYQNDGI